MEVESIPNSSCQEKRSSSDPERSILFVCGLFYFVAPLFSHALLPFCAETPHLVMPRLAHRGRRSALNERV